MNSNFEDIVEPPKKPGLFLKSLKPSPSTDKIVMNVTEISSKIVEPDTYDKAIGDLSFYATYWKEAICIEFEILHLNNI